MLGYKAAAEETQKVNRDGEVRTSVCGEPNEVAVQELISLAATDKNRALLVDYYGLYSKYGASRVMLFSERVKTDIPKTLSLDNVLGV